MKEMERNESRNGFPYEKLMMGLIIATLLVFTFNSLQLKGLKEIVANGGVVSTVVGNAPGGSTGSASPAVSTPVALDPEAAKIIPKGVPAIYGQELGIAYDDVDPSNQLKANAAIEKLAQKDREITLSDANLERYVNILYKMENGIACEYCCGARSVITPTGEPACGCAHSFAMRGLTKYLLTQHGSEYTDQQLLEEAGKWKTLFFPGQMQLKASILKQKGVELNYINLASNKYRGIEKGATAAGGMVGGC